MARSWEQTGSPLRPSPEDVAAYHGMAREWMEQHGPPRILLLGVTPEIFGIPWPPKHDFVAMDQTAAMIKHVWPGSAGQVVQANWLDLPLPSRSRDLVFCDGGLHLLDYPDGARKLIERLHDVVAPGGVCIFRFFVLPEKEESTEVVLSDLMEGRIPDLNVLKLRLGMAMQKSPEAGVRVHDVWTKLHRLAGDWDELADQLKWPRPHLRAIDAYFESRGCYHFISLEGAKKLFSEGGFSFLGAHFSSYPLGERCPVVAFSRR